MVKDMRFIPVHNHVNGQIQSDGNPGHSCVSDKLSVTQKCSSAMVVSVKERERLLLEHEEKCINQLEVLGQIVELRALDAQDDRAWSQTYVVEDDQLSSPATIMIANCMEDTLSGQSWKELFNEQSQQDTTDDSQVEVMNHKRTIQDKSLTVFHQLSSSKDYDIV